MDHSAGERTEGRVAASATATVGAEKPANVSNLRNTLYEEHKASIMNDLRRNKAMEQRQKILGNVRSKPAEMKRKEQQADATQKTRLLVRKEHERQIRMLMAKARAVNAMMKKYPHSTTNTSAHDTSGTRHQQHVQHQKRCFKTLQNTVNRADSARDQQVNGSKNITTTTTTSRRQVRLRGRLSQMDLTKIENVLHEVSSDDSESEDSDTEDSDEESSDDSDDEAD